jgi:hypothetical protein
VIGCLFECFADHGVDQRLAALQVASRLVIADAVLGFLLDQQEAAIRSSTEATVTLGFQTIAEALNWSTGAILPPTGGEIG